MKVPLNQLWHGERYYGFLTPEATIVGSFCGHTLLHFTAVMLMRMKPQDVTDPQVHISSIFGEMNDFFIIQISTERQFMTRNKEVMRFG